MKMFFLIFIGLILIHGYLPAQNRGNQWLLSKQPFVSDCGIDFNSGTADTFSIWKDLEFFATDASICDTTGQIAFYTNAIIINNRENQILLNSSGFNPGGQTTEDSLDGLSASQGAIIVPHPGIFNQYSIFHISGEEILNDSQTQPLIFRYSEVDMTLDGGLGGVILDKKGVEILNDTLVWGRLTACKHANGIDWWIITHRWNSDLYYKFLLTKDSLFGPSEQHIGSIVIKDDVVGQACFSPDGSKYAYMNCNYNFDYFQFNRCTGEFSNAVNILLLDSNLSQGISFSPNNRFIYCNTYTQLFQFDTWAEDMQSSMNLIDTIPFNGVTDLFAVEMLAPDNKIYMSTYNGFPALHVINNPDSLGQLCQFIRAGLTLPASNLYSIPNHPNYDLGELISKDTCQNIFTQLQTIEKDNNYRIECNFVSNWINIIYQSEKDAQLELFDIYGKKVAGTSLFHYFKNRLLNVSDLSTGVYFAIVNKQGKRVLNEKVIIIH